MKKKSILGLILLALLVVACSPSNQNVLETNENQEGVKEGGKVDIIAASYPVYDFTKKIVGDKLVVESMIPSGAEPHHWEPSPKEINKLESAQVFVFNGAGYQMWIDKLLDNLENKDLIAVDTTAGLDLMKASHDHNHDHDHDHDHDYDHGHVHGDYDPHTWTSPKMAKEQAKAIYEAVAKYDPENADYYSENFEKLTNDLDQLDAEYTEGLKNVKNKHLVISHESFGYLAHDYGLSQVGIRGYFDDQEPDPKTMKQIVEFIEEANVPVIFGETTGDKKVIETVANEAGVEVAYLNPLETLSKEELEEGQDYLYVMDENLKILKEALNK